MLHWEQKQFSLFSSLPTLHQIWFFNIDSLNTAIRTNFLNPTVVLTSPSNGGTLRSRTGSWGPSASDKQQSLAVSHNMEENTPGPLPPYPQISKRGSVSPPQIWPPASKVTTAWSSEPLTSSSKRHHWTVLFYPLPFTLALTPPVFPYGLKAVASHCHTSFV